jgi:hypothetical protein
VPNPVGQQLRAADGWRRPTAWDRRHNVRHRPDVSENPRPRAAREVSLIA